jgi:hypothetical protein
LSRGRPGAAFRNSDKPVLATSPFPGCTTIYETFQYAKLHNSKRRAVGTRAVLKARKEGLTFAAPGGERPALART